jgi:two-component system LytT family response regulator
MQKIRTLIIDDERLAREGIRSLLASDRDIEIIGECADGVEALSAIRSQHPDLLVLDIQMPGKDGFAVLAGIEPNRLPATIFVTAFDTYAVKAFSVHAIDYILKPVEPRRFASALRHAKKIISSAGGADNQKRLLGLLSDIEKKRTHPDRIAIKLPGRIYFVDTNSLDWIEAAGDYCILHVQGEKHMIREPLKSVESMLDQDLFLRIHRSVIIRIDRIKELQPRAHGEFRLILTDGSVHTVSRSYRQKIEQALHLPS